MSQRITLDYANCLNERIGNAGLEPELLRQRADQMAELTDRLAQSRGTGLERWRDLPFDPMRGEHLQGVNALAETHRQKTDNLIVLGIGGSALGNIALQAALNSLTWNLLPADQRAGPRLFVLDNVDPLLVGQTLDFVAGHDPGFEHTLVNVISKSGETAETAAQFILFRDQLEQALGDRWPEHVVAVTDPEQGTMRSICDRYGIASLPVPDGVGGRFSVLSPVGLFSAAMCGIDVEQLLDGAAAMDERCSERELTENPAAMLALLLIEHARRGRSNHVLMPYCNSLYMLADWYRQLWAESLGKRYDLDGREIFAGPTPIKALGTTDQHSQVQLYREGPDDKVIGFVEIERLATDVEIPAGLDVESLQYLQGATLGELLKAEKQATEYALVESERPNFTIRLPELSAYTVGQFIQLWQVATAYAGLLLNINAYDQPAVETGKVATFGLMGRSGYETWRDRVHQTLESSQHVID